MIDIKKIETIKYESNLQIDLIEIDPEINVRTEKVDIGIGELKESINNIGLIEPIMVAKLEKGKKYKLIVGQRRLLACKGLNKKTISARIIKPVDLITAKIISFTENLQKRDLTTLEKQKAAKILFNIYKGSKESKIKKIAKDLGVNIYNVIAWLQEDAVPREVLKLVSEKKLSSQKAWQLTAALLGKAEKIIKLAKEIAKPQISDPERNVIIMTAKKIPEASGQEIIKKSREPGVTIKVILHLDMNVWRELNKQSRIRGYEKGQDLIKKLIDEYLDKEGLK